MKSELGSDNFRTTLSCYEVQRERERECGKLTDMSV